MIQLRNHQIPPELDNYSQMVGVIKDMRYQRQKGVISEISRITRAIQKGNFAERTDSMAFEGYSRKILEEVNNILDVTGDPHIPMPRYGDEILKGIDEEVYSPGSSPNTLTAASEGETGWSLLCGLTNDENQPELTEEEKGWKFLNGTDFFNDQPRLPDEETGWSLLCELPYEGSQIPITDNLSSPLNQHQ
ncbi:MAG TPA: hypothetical protein VN372_10245 [Methanospirillum sp.]|nr:hypothetical protein [Methanospirillum sp.]